MKQVTSISGFGSISTLGSEVDAIAAEYNSADHHLSIRQFGEKTVTVANLDREHINEIELIRKEDARYRSLDKSVLFAIYAARKALSQAGWNSKDHIGINIGSSRGATASFEKYHKDFLENQTCLPKSSPETTLGNISSWVAQDIQSSGPVMSHSITCSTGLHAVLNGIAWLQAGLSEKFIVGGSESPLTPFTISQMEAMKIYTEDQNAAFPCRALDLTKEENTMVLGEGCGLACIELGIHDQTLGVIEGYGYATETICHGASLSNEGLCIQRAMKMALRETDPNEIDAVILHAPGTILGDASEVNAVQHIFQDKIPYLTSNKWKIGHTLAASGMLSMELALLMLQGKTHGSVPYLKDQVLPQKINKVLVNSLGFGGNAVSLVIAGI